MKRAANEELENEDKPHKIRRTEGNEVVVSTCASASTQPIQPKPFRFKDPQQPWFVHLVQQAEEIFGVHIFSFVLGPHFHSLNRCVEHCCSLLTVTRFSLLTTCKWFFNTLNDFTSYIQAKQAQLPDVLMHLNSQHLKRVSVWGAAPIEDDSVPDTHFRTHEAPMMYPFRALSGLYFCNIQMEFSVVVEILENLPCLRTLSFFSCCLNETVLVPLEKFDCFKKLRHIDIYDVSPVIADYCYTHMFRVASQSTCLKRLDLGLDAGPTPSIRDFFSEGITRIANLTSLSLSPPLKDFEITNLANLTKLKELEFGLSEAGVTPKAFEDLTKLCELNNLICRTYVDAVPFKFLKPLSKLTNLKTLTIEGATPDSPNLQDWGLHKLTQLEELELDWDIMEFTHVECVTTLPNLKRLIIMCPNTASDPAGYNFLGELTSLNELSICIIPEGLVYSQTYTRLLNLTNLTKLALPSLNDFFVGMEQAKLFALSKNSAHFNPECNPEIVRSQGITPLISQLKELAFMSTCSQLEKEHAQNFFAEHYPNLIVQLHSEKEINNI